jgi:hypothetical protein
MLTSRIMYHTPMIEKWHGTLDGYTNHRCRCEGCRKANAAWQKGARLRRTKAKLPSNRKHGVYATYLNYGCRCKACKKANADYGNSRRSKGAPENAKHGTYTTYSNFNCRCEDCRQAASDYNRRRYLARKANQTA